jgi:hypothetical protein
MPAASRSPEPARFRRAYRVVSRVMEDDLGALLGHAAGDPDWADSVWEHYTALPEDPRYRALAREIAGVLRAEYAKDPVAKAIAVKRWLEERATYSFANKYEGEDDPTGAFLFSEEKKGYCVHTAHAAAYLLRALGVPTRVSAGYAVPAENLGGGSALLVKTGDAHAWAEIYLDGLGWAPVEVTPEKTDVEPRPFEEKDLQQLLGEMARKEGREERQGARGPKLLDLLRRVAAAVPYAVAMLLALAYLTKLWRLVAPHVIPGRAAARLAYRAALDRLAAAGILRARGEPRERFARRVAGAAPSFAALTQAQVASALGSARAKPELERPRLVALAGGVGRELRRALPWWRWALGLVDPLSWLRSR